MSFGWGRRASEEVKERDRRRSEAESFSLQSMSQKLDELLKVKQTRDSRLSEVETALGALKQENIELKEEICHLKEDFESLQERFEVERRARELEKEEMRVKEVKKKRASMRKGTPLKSSDDEEDWLWNKAGQDTDSEGENEAPPPEVLSVPSPKKKKGTTKKKKTIRKKKAPDVSELLASLSEGTMFSLDEGQGKESNGGGSGSVSVSGGSGSGGGELTLEDPLQQALADLDPFAQSSSSATSVSEGLFTNDSTPSIASEPPTPTEEGGFVGEGGKRQKRRKKKRELLDHVGKMSLQDVCGFCFSFLFFFSLVNFFFS